MSVAKVSGGAGLSPLVVAFEGNATADAARAVLRSLTYANVESTANARPRYIGITFVDADGKVSAQVFKRTTGTASPLATFPAVPLVASGAGGNSEIGLSWAAPLSNGGAPITDYAIQYSANSGLSWTTYDDGVSTVTSVDVTGLINGVSYVFRVAAVNSVGSGACSARSGFVSPTHEIIVRAEVGLVTTDGPIRSGTTQLIKRGLGTLVLEKANSHSGGTVVEAGEVIVGNIGALGTGTLEVRAGASGGGSRGSPRSTRIFRIGAGSVMNAMRRMSPPQAGHSSGNSSAILTFERDVNSGSPGVGAGLARASCGMVGRLAASH